MKLEFRARPLERGMCSLCHEPVLGYVEISSDEHPSTTVLQCYGCVSALKVAVQHGGQVFTRRVKRASEPSSDKPPVWSAHPERPRPGNARAMSAQAFRDQMLEKLSAVFPDLKRRHQ